jgi:hypothetical protein
MPEFHTLPETNRGQTKCSLWGTNRQQTNHEGIMPDKLKQQNKIVK